MPAPPRIYLAGPEVFLPNAAEVGSEKRRLCEEFGFEGVFPLDQSLEIDGLPDIEQARRIALANEGLMRSCDALIANMTPFRGVSMDAGAAFEMGFMRALGKPVFGYTNVPDDYHARARRYRGGVPVIRDADRFEVAVEDYGLADNLMMSSAVMESGSDIVRFAVLQGAEMTDLEGFRDCLEEARRVLVEKTPAGSVG